MSLKRPGRGNAAESAVSEIVQRIKRYCAPVSGEGKRSSQRAQHIYNLRDSKTYASVRVQRTHTQAGQVSIGEQRKPDPWGQPGYLRVDTVHQGHHDGRPEVYHINAGDTVAQWQVVGYVETISENHLAPDPARYPVRLPTFLPMRARSPKYLRVAPASASRSGSDPYPEGVISPTRSPSRSTAGRKILRSSAGPAHSARGRATGLFLLNLQPDRAGRLPGSRQQHFHLAPSGQAPWHLHAYLI